MDIQAVAQALANTMDPQNRLAAEAYLEQVYQMAGFTTCLLQIVMDGSLNTELRLSGAIYLKNTVNKYWKQRTNKESKDILYCIPEEAKAIIRQNIIEGIIQTPLKINKQLCVCLDTIVRQDFPDKWTDIVPKCHAYLSSDNQEAWLGTLMSLHQLSKKYKFKKSDERGPYITAMKDLLPLMYNRMIVVLPNQSEPSVCLQRWMLKIFYCSMHYQLPFELINENTLPSWMMVFQTVIDRPVPPEYEKEDEEERASSEWWKTKKWALHILCSMFERFGSPGNVEDTYNVFADYYMKTFNCSTTGVVNTLLKQLQKAREGVYITPRVKQLIFNYLNEALSHANSWKLIRPHFQEIFVDIVFPLLCYNDDDNQLWHDDPYEYIRMKFDIFEDLVSPVVAAQVFLAEACQKRKNILDPVMMFCVQILNNSSENRDPRKKDGALNVIGTTSDVLMKRKAYKGQLEPMLVAHVFPEFKSPFGYMRARACWMVHYFSEITFEQETHLQYALQEVLSCLTQDKELPVKVEAAVALQHLIKNQTLAEKVIGPHVKPIIIELLRVIKDTENDDLTEVLQELIETYSDNITDVAVDLCSTLASTFNELLDASGGAEEDGYKALTALGLISAIQSLVKSAFKNTEILKQMEAVLVTTIVSIFQNGVMDYYEEMLSLLDLFTADTISPAMWQIMGVLYEAFARDGFDYFSEMMSVVFNYIRVDNEGFLSNPKHVEIVIAMAKTMLTDDPGEDPQTYACKLLEVMLLECKGRIDQYIPSVLEGPLARLTKNIMDPDLRYALVLVVVAALYSNSNLVMELLEKTSFPSANEAITAQFFTSWLRDCQNFEGIHDRKMSVLGLCTVLQSPIKPPAVLNNAPHIIPMIIHQLELLVEAYKKEAEEDNEDDDDDDSKTEEGEVEEEEEQEQEEEDGELDDEEDDKKQRNPLLKLVNKMAEEDDDEDDDPLCLSQTILEIDYQTNIDDKDLVDEFCVFKDTLQTLEATDGEWFRVITSALTPELTAKLQPLFITAEQRRAAMDARKRESAGGYCFTVTAVPNAFTFHSP